MSFLTSFWPFPQKEHERLGWSSRLAGDTELNYHQVAVPATSVCVIPWGVTRSWALESFVLRLLVLVLAVLVGDDLVDDAVFLGLAGTHEIVALGVVLDALNGLAGVLDQKLIQVVAST